MKIAKKIIVGVLTLAMLISAFALFSYAEEPHFDYDAAYGGGTYGSIIEYYEQHFSINFNIDGTAVGKAYPDEDAVLTQLGASIKIAEEAGDKHVAISGHTGIGLANSFLRWSADTDLNGVVLNFDLSAAIVELPGGVSTKCARAVCRKSTKTYTMDEFRAAFPQFAETDPTVGEEIGNCSCGNAKGKIKVQAISDAIYQYPVAHVILSDVLEDGETAKDTAHSIGLDLLVLNSKEDKLMYGTVIDGEFTYVTVEDSVFDYDPTAWYSVELIYNAVCKTYNLTLTNKADAENKLVLTDVAANLDAIRTVKIGSSGAAQENNNTTVKLANLTAQGGTFHRVDGDIQTESDKWVEWFGEDIKIVEASAKAKIVDTYMKLVEVGYVPGSAEAQAAIESIFMSSIEATEDYVSSINENASYAKRLSDLGIHETFLRFLPSDTTGYDPEIANRIAAARLAYGAEIDAVEALKNESLYVVDKLATYNAESNDYGYLTAVLADLNSKRYDLTVPGTDVAVDAYSALEAKIANIEFKAESFIALIKASDVTLQANAGKLFTELYPIFCDAKAHYYDNITYPPLAGVKDNPDTPDVNEHVEGYFEAYNRLDAFYAKCIDVNKDYIEFIYKAGLSEYINARKELLAGAYALTVPSASAPEGTTYSEYFKPEYPGVADAMVKYVELKKTVDDKEAAAGAYIAAVAALEGLEGEALLNGIATAEALKVAGNITGVAGVDLANILLDNIKTELSLTVGYSDKYVKLAASLKEAKNLSERFAIISEMLSIKDIYLDGSAEVASAKAELTAAVAAYNADVAAVNAVILGVAAAS